MFLNISFGHLEHNGDEWGYFSTNSSQQHIRKDLILQKCQLVVDCLWFLKPQKRGGDDGEEELLNAWQLSFMYETSINLYGTAHSGHAIIKIVRRFALLSQKMGDWSLWHRKTAAFGSMSIYPMNSLHKFQLVLKNSSRCWNEFFRVRWTSFKKWWGF